MVPKRALLIVNRKSRSGTSDIEAAVSRLKEAGTRVIACRIDSADEIPQRIRLHAENVDCVIVGGGDGTLNAAAQVLMETRLPLGVLPMGTANDLARTLKIPTDLAQASDVINSGLLHRIDLGCVNGHYFFNVANIGLGVHVKQFLSSELKQRWGVFSYAYSLFKAMKSFRPFHADIECDGRRFRVRSIQIAVGNGRHYGGGMTIAETASIDDHCFFLYSIEPLSLWELVRVAPALRSGRFEERHPVDLAQGRHIRVTTRKAMVVTADGETVTRTPAEFDMKAGALSVFVPADYFDDRQEIRHAAQR
ncbi:MAG TPA: lipid kinase [Noviherbaspirillum sp.]